VIVQRVRSHDTAAAAGVRQCSVADSVLRLSHRVLVSSGHDHWSTG